MEDKAEKWGAKNGQTVKPLFWITGNIGPNLIFLPPIFLPVAGSNRLKHRCRRTRTLTTVRSGHWPSVQRPESVGTAPSLITARSQIDEHP